MQTFQQFLNEQKDPNYTEWGWIKPDGTYVSGDDHPEATNHIDLLFHLDFPGADERPFSRVYNNAFKKGWVRYFREKKTGGSASFEAKYDASMKTLIKYLQKGLIPSNEIRIYLLVSYHGQGRIPDFIYTQDGDPMPAKKALGYARKAATAMKPLWGQMHAGE